MSEERAIGVIGVGCVGLVSATCFAELGPRVVAVDIVPATLSALRAGQAPIHERRLQAILVRNADRVAFATDIVAAAEMIKLAANAFLATKISFINEIANVCEEVGADVTEVARGMGLDERIGGSFLRAGIGYGGSCFPKDVSALKQLAGNTGYHFQLLTAVIEVNELQKRRVIGKLQKHLGSLAGKEIALLGVAFKPDTDDVREATSLVLAGRLQSEGANVRVYDPVATDRARELLGSTTVASSALEALDGAHGAVLVTEWPEFRDLDWAGEAKRRMASPVVV